MSDNLTRCPKEQILKAGWNKYDGWHLISNTTYLIGPIVTNAVVAAALHDFYPVKRGADE